MSAPAALFISVVFMITFAIMSGPFESQGYDQTIIWIFFWLSAIASAISLIMIIWEHIPIRTTTVTYSSTQLTDVDEKSAGEQEEMRRIIQNYIEREADDLR